MGKSIIKYFTLFTSIIAVILGGLVTFNTIESTEVINYILVVILGLIGIAKICSYASQKNPIIWDLVLGILYLIVSIFLLANGNIVMGTTVGYVFAFLAILGSISHFMIAAEIRKHFKKAPIAGDIICGIIYALIGICFIAMPIFTQLLYVYIIGIFLIVAGIVGIINALMIPTGDKK